MTDKVSSVRHGFGAHFARRLNVVICLQYLAVFAFFPLGLDVLVRVVCALELREVERLYKMVEK